MMIKHLSQMLPLTGSSHLLRLFVTSLLATCSFAQQCHAEDGDKNWHGAYGVNRVVRTKSDGYVEVVGNFAVTSTLPNRANTNVLAHDNRPNVYFGGDVDGTEVDGGLIWEPKVDVYEGLTYDPGWAAFIRGGSIANTNPRIWINGQSRAWRQTAGSTPTSANITSGMDLTFEEDGSIALFVSALPGGTFYHKGGSTPASATNTITPTAAQRVVVVDNGALDSADVKRVVALTRAGGVNDPTGYNDELDGTQMTTVFTGGKVRRININAGEDPYNLRNWQASDVDQGATGYDSKKDGADNRRAWDKVVRNRRGNFVLSRGQNPSRTVTEFPKLDVGNRVGRGDSPASHAALEGDSQGNNLQSRYTQETVRINLRVVGAAQGRGRP